MFWALLICLLPWGEAGCQEQNRTTTAPPPPVPTQTGSPVDFFRKLIAATPEEREQLLRRRAPDSAELRAALEKHALLYQTLPAEQRELRLRNMELRYHLTSLLYAAPSNRTERLKLVPDRDRPLVENRLKYWDNLSPEQQKEVLKDERLTREIIGTGRLRIPPNPTLLTGQTSNQFVRIEQQMVQWQILTEARRAKVQEYFFELTDEEKAKEKLGPLPLSPEERQLMQVTLDQFQKLAPSQRANCIKNFAKFAELTPAERQAFLVNAGEWQKMSTEDRETWRKLISKVPPPLPQLYRRPPLPPGLRPQGMAGSSRTGSVTTVPGTN
jgi:hypothetical protein